MSKNPGSRGTGHDMDHRRTGWLDVARQLANLVLAIAMPLASVLVFGPGTGGPVTGRDLPELPIEPARYAFAIWAPIYAGTLVYGVYQARSVVRGNDLLRRVGWLTASAFLASVLWLALARSSQVGLRVALVVWMWVSLVPVFLKLTGMGAHTLSRQERWLIRAPLAVFTGWVTVALFVSLASGLQVAGMITPESAPAFSAGLLATAGAIALVLIFASRGNMAFGLTVIWGLVAIALANRDGGPEDSPLVGGLAAAFAVLAGLTTTGARFLDLDALVLARRRRAPR